MKVRALGQAELLLFWRNKTAVFNALALPVAVVALLSGLPIEGEALSRNAFIITSMLAFVMLVPVYHNLVSTFVARREDLVLKRLRVGELSDGAILVGTASPATVIALLQIALYGGVGAVLMDLPMPVNFPVLLVGVLGGVALFTVLAAASSVFTRTVEMAQITSLPVLLGCVLGSGLMVPLTVFPDAVAKVLRLLPLTPVLDLMRLGWLGTTGSGAPKDFAGVLSASVSPLMALVSWTVLGAFAVHRWFRWEPRR
jgi:ABC-2 type transport system permease protein